MPSQLYCGDCLKIMPTLPAASADLILCDLPYGTTACKWDSIIPLDVLWREYTRVSKGPVVLTAAQPFTSKLVMSNIANYKHHWVWVKEKGTGFQVAKYRPMMITEDVIMFNSHKTTYNPQMTPREKPLKYKYPTVQSRSNPLANYENKTVISIEKFPENTIRLNTERGLHPTQKPVALMEYLIRTYTNPGDMVLDNCMGSGTTGVACANTDREFIGIEQDPAYFAIAQERIVIAEFERACR